MECRMNKDFQKDPHPIRCILWRNGRDNGKEKWTKFDAVCLNIHETSLAYFMEKCVTAELHITVFVIQMHNWTLLLNSTIR